MYLDGKNPYTILQVPSTATKQQLRKSYQELSKIYHPDKAGNSVYFRQVNTAYKLVGNPFWQFLKQNFGQQAINIYQQQNQEINYFEQLFNQLTDQQLQQGEQSHRFRLFKRQLCLRIQQLINNSYDQKVRSQYLDKLSSNVIIDCSNIALSTNNLLKQLQTQAKIPIPSIFGHSLSLNSQIMCQQKRNIKGLVLQSSKTIKIKQNVFNLKTQIQSMYPFNNYKITPSVQMNTQNYRLSIQPLSFNHTTCEIGKIQTYFKDSTGKDIKLLLHKNGSQIIIHKQLNKRLSLNFYAGSNGKKFQAGFIFYYQIIQGLKLTLSLNSEIHRKNQQTKLQQSMTYGFSTDISNNLSVQIKNKGDILQLRIGSQGRDLNLILLNNKYSILINIMVAITAQLYKNIKRISEKQNHQIIFKRKIRNHQHLQNKYHNLQILRQQYRNHLNQFIMFQKMTKGLLFLNCYLGSQQKINSYLHLLKNNKKPPQISVNSQIIQFTQILQAQIGTTCILQTSFTRIVNQIYNPCLNAKQDPIILLRYNYRGQQVYATYTSLQNQINIPVYKPKTRGIIFQWFIQATQLLLGKQP